MTDGGPYSLHNQHRLTCRFETGFLTLFSVFSMLCLLQKRYDVNSEVAMMQPFVNVPGTEVIDVDRLEFRALPNVFHSFRHLF